MELMDMSLDMLLDEHHISTILHAVDLMLQVAEGMKYLHNMGIVHREFIATTISILPTINAPTFVDLMGNFFESLSWNFL
jgi:hypothetical protein